MTTALIGALLATACSSSNDKTGAGGSSSGSAGAAGTTGAAGSTGAGGSAGTTGEAGASGVAGTTGAGGSAQPSDGAVTDAFMGTVDARSAPYAAVCASTVKNKGACMTATDVQCANTCGPNKSGYKNCDCYSDVWDCPRCEYVPDDYSCYRLPDPPEACPMVETDAGPSLPQVGTACTRAPCKPCGAATALSYLDSVGSPKTGYCVCGSEQKWTCASTTEWPQ